jgi:DNA polymerase-3 subunit delta'
VPNNNAEAAFYHSMSAGRFPHAVLLEGGSVESRRQTAASFCAAWLCEASQPPCGICRHCRKASQWIHPDVTTLADGEGKQIPVDAVRALIAQCIVKPGEAARRVFVVENAHRLTPQGQNALLKCIEEPPPAVCFLLLCPSRKELLPTILSRVTAYSLPGADEEFSAEAVATAQKIADALARHDEWGVLAATAPFDKAKPLLQESLRVLKEMLRAGLLRASGAAELADKVEAAALAQLGAARLTVLLECAQALERDTERNANLSLLRTRISATMFV